MLRIKYNTNWNKIQNIMRYLTLYYTFYHIIFLRVYQKIVYNVCCKDINRYGSTCVICLEGMDIKNKLAKLRRCNHVFHKDCIIESFKFSNNKYCPTCRQ